MALDGITISNINLELNNTILGGKIDKIYQPFKDEIILSIRNMGKTFKLLLTANSNNPRIHLTEILKENPQKAPLFCMVLRKHILGSKIISIEQPKFERIINITIEGINELGDIGTKTLVIEIMGKHSNIILLDKENIIDSIKRISYDKSSIREVLPNKKYILPPSQNKKNPLNTDIKEFSNILKNNKNEKIYQIIYKNYTGISPIMANEICNQANINNDLYINEIDNNILKNLFEKFINIFNIIKLEKYNPEIIYDKSTKNPIEFSVIEMTQFSKDFKRKKFESISKLLEEFYAEKDNIYNLKQKSYDMRKIILNNIERCIKKFEIQNKTLKSIENKDNWRIKGELLTANIYNLKLGMKTFKTINFYDENMPEIEIKLDPTKTPSENAQKYFSKYNKAKRTLLAINIQQKQNEEELSYLESILNSLENSTKESDLIEIRQELANSGYMKKTKLKKEALKNLKKSQPINYISSDGYDILVGKSNLQNDNLTLHIATPNDLWLHTKNIPGSHIIIKTEGKCNNINDLPDNTLLEAANIAVINSKAKNDTLVPVDYTFRKNIKKPNGSKPGMVIYDKNWTVYITPDESKIKNLKKFD